MLPGLLQLAKFRKICIFDERALGGWEKGATRVIRKCLISFSSLCQSWWLLRTAQLQGGVLAPRKQAEQQSWAVFSASGKSLFAAEGAICQCTHCASSCLPAEGAASGQYWQLENPSTSGWLSCWDHTWTQKRLAWQCLVLGQHGPCAMWKPPGVLSCLVSWQKSKTDCPSVYFSNSK